MFCVCNTPRLAAAPASDTDTVTDTFNLITAKLAKVHEMLVERLVALSFDVSISFAYNRYSCLLMLLPISRDTLVVQYRHPRFLDSKISPWFILKFHRGVYM